MTYRQAGAKTLQPRAPAPAALRSLDFLHDLFVAREGRLLALLGSALGSAPGGRPSKEDTFELWMKQESNLVQVSKGAKRLSITLELSTEMLTYISVPVSVHT